MRFQFFVFAWPGYLQSALEIEQSLLERGEEVVVISSGLEEGPSHWLKLSNEAYFGDQFSLCLQMFGGDVLVHIQSDARIADWNMFLQRMKSAYEHDTPGIWAPDVNYTFYQTSIVRFNAFGLYPSKGKSHSRLIGVLNTDCTCWSLRSELVDQLKEFVRPDWNLGWGWDSLAAAISWSQGYPVIRDLEIQVQHKRGTGYDANRAALEFQRVKKDLPSELQVILEMQESLIRERYARSGQWIKDQIRSRFRSSK